MAGSDWSRWSACSLTSTRARSTSRGRSARPDCRSRSRRFHISGCLAMLDGAAVELDACRALGISMFAGEAEGRFDAVLRDAASGRLRPAYDFLDDLPELETA